MDSERQTVSQGDKASVFDEEVLLLDDSGSNDSQSAATQQSTKSLFASGGDLPAFESNRKETENLDRLHPTPTETLATLTAEETKRQELKKLSLDEHGTFMVDFHPEKSKRELRKLNRKLCSKETKKSHLYDGQGVFIGLNMSMDLCDCLDKGCQGCHLPCPKCSSTKCGHDCRCNRKYLVDFIEIEGTDTVRNFPF